MKFFEVLSVVALLLPFKSVLLKGNHPSSRTCISVKLALCAFEKKNKQNKTRKIVLLTMTKIILDTFSIEVGQISFPKKLLIE